MSAIIPYAAQELAKPQNAAMAVDLFTEAGKAAAGMYKSYKGRRKTRGKTTLRGSQVPRADLGGPAGRDESRRVEDNLGVTAANNKTLYQRALIRAEKNVAANESINKRNRDVITHKGCKICFSIKNVLKVPIFFNWAVVIPKAVNAVSADNILRSSATERDEGIGTAMTFMDTKCLPINTDRYKVVKLKRLTILPDSDKSATPSEGRDFRMVEEYIKTNRKIYFEGDNAEPLQNMFMIWWCDYYNSPTAASIGTCDVSYRIVNYFHDVP